MPSLIVFICTGNLCRSPMAEAIFKARWPMLKTNNHTVHCSSMGIHAGKDQHPPPFAQTICIQHGINISAHQSRPLNLAELESALYIFCMEQFHCEYLNVYLPRLRDKTFLLGTWPNIDKKKGNIKDPMGGSFKVYSQVFEQIWSHVHRIIQFL